jgi:hypothetical protein
MTDRILKILDNVRYWETCPEDYKKDIETFLEAQSQALRIHDVVGQSELLNAFLDYSDKIYWAENDVTDRREVIEQFLKSIQ